MSSRFEEADLGALKRISIEERGGLIDVRDFVVPFDPGADTEKLLNVIPGLFSGADLMEAAGAVVRASRDGRPVVAMVGAHFIKCGLSRLLNDLLERRVVTAVALNGAGAIHDYEIARWGRTSEDVSVRLQDGSFGMCADTADAMNAAVRAGADSGQGMGEALGRDLVERDAPHLDASILAAGHVNEAPVTVHVALGTDIVHQHPSADGAATGETSLRDFRILSSVLSDMGGGVVMNIGSAVVLPEVFLKALSVARNLGGADGPLTTISMDMNVPYRAMVNVVARPTAGAGRGIVLRGRHEFLFPLFWAAVRRGLSSP